MSLMSHPPISFCHTDRMSRMAETEYKYAGVMFRCIDAHTGEILYLLGQEANVPGWSEANKWSDFGGGLKDAKEDPIDAMAREATEETMGMRGCAVALAAEIRKDGRIFNLPEFKAIVCILDTAYDPTLAEHYNNTYKHLTQCMKDHPSWKGFRNIPSCPEGYLEKVQLRWWSEKDILAHEAEMRPAFFKTF